AAVAVVTPARLGESGALATVASVLRTSRRANVPPSLPDMPSSPNYEPRSWSRYLGSMASASRVGKADVVLASNDQLRIVRKASGIRPEVGMDRIGRHRDLRYQIFDQPPKIGLAGIAADAADLAPLVDEHEHRRHPFNPDEIEIARDRRVNVDAA